MRTQKYRQYLAAKREIFGVLDYMVEDLVGDIDYLSGVSGRQPHLEDYFRYYFSSLQKEIKQPQTSLAYIANNITLLFQMSALFELTAIKTECEAHRLTETRAAIAGCMQKIDTFFEDHESSIKNDGRRQASLSEAAIIGKKTEELSLSAQFPQWWMVEALAENKHSPELLTINSKVGNYLRQASRLRLPMAAPQNA